MFDAISEPVLTFVRDNRNWAFWIALVFAIAETTAFTSLLVPSSAILIGVGALIATGELQLLPIWVGASIGAVIGSTVSWWIGWHYGDRILATKLMMRHENLVKSAQGMFFKFGPLAVLLGHFVGPLRPFAFILSGMSKMPPLKFHIYNLPGAVAWAFLVPAIGFAGGSALGWLLDYLPI
jgi:membrane protein DedA with SNARE-associated domain